jgi:hypothetical protein
MQLLTKDILCILNQIWIWCMYVQLITLLYVKSLRRITQISALFQTEMQFVEYLTLCGRDKIFYLIIMITILMRLFSIQLSPVILPQRIRYFEIILLCIIPIACKYVKFWFYYPVSKICDQVSYSHCFNLIFPNNNWCIYF